MQIIHQNLPTLLIVDDHHAIRYVLAQALSDAKVCTVVGQSSTGTGAIELTSQLHPDIVLLDAMMPDSNGLDCVRMMRRSTPRVKIIVFTGNSNPLLIGRAVELGIQGFIEKSAEFNELIDAVRIVASGKTHYSNSVRPTIRKIQSSPFPLGAGSRLTAREHTVLQGVAAGKSSKEIGAELGLSIFTINNHRRRIKNKTGFKSTSELTLHALQLGLVQDHQAEIGEAMIARVI